METIFDHNPTQQELVMLFGPRPMTREEYLSVVEQESAYGDLYRLYSLRGKPEIAEQFLNKITDEDYRLTLAMHDIF
jgi:hypothetical protein